MLPAERACRDTAPSRTWDFRAFETWKDCVRLLISDIIDEKVLANFLADPPEYVVCDNLAWLNNIIYSVRGKTVDAKVLLSERLRHQYDALRAVHGTRTEDLEPFYREGLTPLIAEKTHKDARRLFLGGAFPELTEIDLEKAIHTVGAKMREGRVYFEVDEEMLIDQAGHYMLYGSEYLIAIAAHLPGNRDYRQVLKTRGEPTLFVCDVPLKLISERTLQEFAGLALEAIFQELLDGPNYEQNRWQGAGFYISETLNPNHLIGHYHPNVTNDPLPDRFLR